MLAYCRLGTNFTELWAWIPQFSTTKIDLGMWGVKWRPFFLGLNVIRCSLALCVSGVTVLPNSRRSRLALSFLWVTVIVILASYSGTLISYLAVDVRNLPFTSLQQVIESPSYNIWMDTESIYAEIFGVSIYIYNVIHIGLGFPIWAAKNSSDFQCRRTCVA